MKPKVSVLIPVYNTAEYLATTIDSIVNQTLREIEIIIIDDGSTDDSLEIIKQYASKDNRIKFISKSNSGLSETRNLALTYASGEYLYFMDSDDILDITALRRGYDLACSKNLDLVVFDAAVFGADNLLHNSGLSYDRSEYLESERIYSGNEIITKMINCGVFKSSVCLHIINREFSDSLSLKFYPGILHEDELYTPQLYFKASRVGYIPEKLFNRRIRENSIMTKDFSPANMEGYSTVIAELYKLRVRYPQNISVIKKLITKNGNYLAYNANKMSFYIRFKTIKLFVKTHSITSLRLKNLTILFFPFVFKIKKLLKR